MSGVAAPRLSRARPGAVAVASAGVARKAAALAPATFTIGELAREFGLTTRAIRFYEDCGLIAPARSGRQRVYTARDRARLTLTLRGKRLGLKLAEVRELVDMYEPQRDNEGQLRRFVDVLARQRAELEARLVELQATLAEVVAHEAATRRLLRARSR
jgi:DNA-binding transcriptional MerR regulator